MLISIGKMRASDKRQVWTRGKKLRRLGWMFNFKRKIGMVHDAKPGIIERLNIRFTSHS